MGWLTRLMGTDPQTRVDKARKLLSRGEYNEARWAVEDVSHPDAGVLKAQAIAGLVLLNIDEAKARFSAGDSVGAREHLEIAREFGASPDQLKEVRRHGRAIREQAAAATAVKAKVPIKPEGDDPLWGLPPDDPRLRYAMRLEGWPEALRLRLSKLGPSFAQAVMSIEDGDPARAWEALTPFADQDPVARFERSRAALALGRLPAAASDLAAFADAVGHQRISGSHSAITHAQVLARVGRAAEGLDMLTEVVKKDGAIDLRGARASLMEALGDLGGAQKEAEALLRKAPKDQGLYRMLARTRQGQGDRVGAAAALEAGLATTCSNPGKCGQQPYDVQSARMLARLYLEDRAQPERVEELLKKLAANAQEPAWEDRYLEALVARNDGNLRVNEMADALRQALQPGDRRHAWVDSAFSSAA
jgi:tetratricopeptide (TPR) repeat protein